MEEVSEAPACAREPSIDQHPSEKKKAPRKRMRKLFASIREQMEFYFSDSNLRRDRFLRKEIEQNIDGYVPLALFQNFNKMKAICTDPVTIAMALRKCSQVLEVSGDGLRVRRRTPIPTENQADIDNRTVYVECLPQDVNHDWVKNVFSGYGKIAYISLPRWKATGDPKGFAFVEFETADDAQVCCKAFQGSADFGSAHCFPKGSKQLLQLRRRAAVQDVQVPLLTALPAAAEDAAAAADEPAAVDKDDEEVDVKQKPKRKRKKAEAVSEEDEGADNGDGEQNAIGEVGNQIDGRRPKKRLRKGGDGEPAEEAPSSAVANEAARTAQALDSGRRMPAMAVDRSGSMQDPDVTDASHTEPQPDDDTSTDDETEQGQKSARHRSRKKRKSNKMKAGKVEHLKELDLLKLKVIPKSQWLRLRSEYLNLQKLNVAALKKALQRADPAKPSEAAVDRRPESAADSRTGTAVNATEDAADEKRSLPSIEFVANVIVKVACTKGTMTYKFVKASLPPELEVAYIDVADGTSEGFVRCKTKPSAELLCDTGSIGDLSFTAVRDSEEQAYWDKLRADREQKRGRKRPGGNASKRKLRGTEKIAAKAEKMTAKTMAAAAGIGAFAPGSTAASKLANKHIHF